MVGNARTKRAVERTLSWWCSQLYRGTSRIAVLSPGFKRILMGRGVPADKIEVVPNWAEEEIFKPERRNYCACPGAGDGRPLQRCLRRQHGALPGSGVGDPGRGKAAPPRAVPARLRREWPGGGRSEAARGRTQTRERSFPRPSSPGRDWSNHRAATASVSLEDRPFFAATIPSKTQAALACGRPLVMAVRGDAADLVTRADAGVVCEPDNAEALAAAFEHLYLLPFSDSTRWVRGVGTSTSESSRSRNRRGGWSRSWSPRPRATQPRLNLLIRVDCMKASTGRLSQSVSAHPGVEHDATRSCVVDAPGARPADIAASSVTGAKTSTSGP